MPHEVNDPTMPSAVSDLRGARVGDLLSGVGHATARRLDATVLLVPGRGDIGAYRASLDARADEFAGWDGRVVVAPADGGEAHRLLVIDRYDQVYAVHDANDASDLPDADALSEWFRFLATACPECGVIDDPLLAGPTL